MSSADADAVVVRCQADAPRVECADHAVTVAAVPWARHDSRHSRDSEDPPQLAYRCAQAPRHHNLKPPRDMSVRVRFVTTSTVTGRARSMTVTPKSQ